MPPEDAGPEHAAPPEPEPAWAVFTDEPDRRATSRSVPSLETILPDIATPETPAADPFGPDALDAPPVAPPDTEVAGVPSVADELDSLIASLEHAPRIRPDPAFNGPPIGRTTADVDEMASETLAKIYAAQHQYVEAALVYEKLAAREPDRAAAMLEQAAEMRRRRAG